MVLVRKPCIMCEQLLFFRSFRHTIPFEIFDALKYLMEYHHVMHCSEDGGGA